jgi:Family of unknown function (DUF6328)
MNVTPRPSPRPAREELSLNDAASHLLEECRTVVPGMQALFGFQLIAVFNQSFGEKLSSAEQALHIVAIGLVAIGIALLMAPAALHRHTEPMAVSQRFINVSSRLLMWSMVPLVAGMCIDLFLVARIGLHDRTSALLVSGALLGVFVLMWAVLPQSRALQNAFGAVSPAREERP